MKYIHIFVLLSISVLSGCGLNSVQKANVAEFARATEGIGDFSATELAKMRESTIKMNKLRIALAGNKKALSDFIKERKTDQCGEPKKSLVWQECNKEFDKGSVLYEEFSVENVAVRVSAATALSSYGELLLTLVTDTQEAEIQSASDKFVSSVKGVNEQRGETVIDESQLESIGIAIQAIGILVVEKMKADAVKKIVLDTEGTVITLCNLISMDFDLSSLHMTGGVNNTILRLKVDANDVLLRRKATVRDRQIATEAYQFAEETSDKLDTMVKKANEILIKLKKANSQLSRSLEADKSSADDFSEISKLAVQIRELGNIIRVFNPS